MTKVPVRTYSQKHIHLTTVFSTERQDFTCNLLKIRRYKLVWTAADKKHDNETDYPEYSLEREFHYAKANVEQCLHRTINLYVKLIDDRAHNNRNTEKDIRHVSRTVWSSFDSAKV